jgi:hypothetical protein
MPREIRPTDCCGAAIAADIGTHRRVIAGSLMEYKHRDDMRRRGAADELAQLAQNMDLS